MCIRDRYTPAPVHRLLLPFCPEQPENTVFLLYCPYHHVLYVFLLMNGGVVGVFIAPTTKSGRWESVCSMAHRTVRCTLPRHHCRWILAVGASVLWARHGVRCTPDIFCSLSGVPEWARLTSARAMRAFIALQVAVGAEIAVAPESHRTVR